MNTLTIDIKARSCVSIKTHGVFAYAQNKSTQVICVTLKKDLDPPVVWLPPDLRRPEISSISDHRLRQMLEEADLIQAYDITTEFALWKYTLRRLYPWVPEVPVGKLSCIAARAAYLGMNFSVHDLVEELNLSSNDLPLPDTDPEIFTNSGKKITSERLTSLLKFSLSSVEKEERIAEKLIDLPPQELQIWRAILKLNDRGILIRRDFIYNQLEQLLCEEELLKEEFYAITGIRNPMNGDAVIACFKQHGVLLNNLEQKELDQAIRMMPQGAFRRAADIYRTVAQNRPLSCKRLLALSGSGSRIRGLWEYYGSSAGNTRLKYLPDLASISGFAVPADKNLFRICRLPAIRNMLSLWTDCPERNSGMIANELKEYCKNAVLKPGMTFYYEKLKFSCFSSFLKFTLPSGRDLYLYKPKLDKKLRLFCQFKYNRTIQMRELSGRMICRMIENALKRDVAMYYLVSLMENNFTPVLFDSEEIVAEDPVSVERDDCFNDLITGQPEWVKELSLQSVMCLCSQWRKQP